MEYMDVPEEKITVIPWGVDHKLLYPHHTGPNRWSGSNPHFTLVCCDIGRKSTISVSKAFQKFSKNSPSHHLILVWRKPSKEVLQIADMPGLKGRVHFASNLSNEELADIYAGETAS